MATTYAPAAQHVPQQQAAEKIKPMTNNKKDKEAPPSPPIKIRDQGNGLQYTRMGFLGEVSDAGVRMWCENAS
jgi:hypothetical protein